MIRYDSGTKQMKHAAFCFMDDNGRPRIAACSGAANQQWEWLE